MCWQRLCISHRRPLLKLSLQKSYMAGDTQAHLYSTQQRQTTARTRRVCWSSLLLLLLLLLLLWCWRCDQLVPADPYVHRAPPTSPPPPPLPSSKAKGLSLSLLLSNLVPSVSVPV
jgi:hypothetical protein